MKVYKNDAEILTTFFVYKMNPDQESEDPSMDLENPDPTEDDFIREFEKRLGAKIIVNSQFFIITVTFLL